MPDASGSHRSAAISAKELAVRRAIVEACKSMNALGINQGTSGNISVRFGDVMLITPTALPYEKMKPTDLCRMPISADYGSSDGALQPSSEWRFHLDILKARPEVGAVVHCHSNYATALAICHKPISGGALHDRRRRRADHQRRRIRDLRHQGIIRECV